MRKFALLIFTLFFMNAYAQYQYDYSTANERSIGLGAQIGYFNPSDADNGNVLLGVLLRAKFTNMIGAEAAISYRSEEYGNGAVSVKSWPITLSALFYPVNAFYGVIGFGLYNTTFDYPDFIAGVQISDETKTEFGFHLGAGVEFPVSNDLRIFGDFRYTFLGYDLKTIDQINLDSDANANFVSITGGVLFMF